MAHHITDDCVQCGACEPECPTAAIYQRRDGEYKIDKEVCVDCVGYFDSPQCVEVCPADAITQKGGYNAAPKYTPISRR